MLADGSYRSPEPNTPSEAGSGGPDKSGDARVREMVLQTLTKRGSLRADAARLTERPVVRGGRTCGVYFALQGPRQLLLTAIWDTDREELWCYDSRGQRFSTMRAG